MLFLYCLTAMQQKHENEPGDKSNVFVSVKTFRFLWQQDFLTFFFG